MPQIFGTHDQNTLDQLNDVAKDAKYAALMADGHMGYYMPIGGVAAYDNLVSIQSVGYDIACGNCAIKTDLNAADIGAVDIQRIADEIADTISFGVGRSNKAKDAPTDHPLFNDAAWTIIRDRSSDVVMRQLKDKAITQLGTVGSGNHYVDVFKDEAGAIWVGVHFGSRGFGHTVASNFLAMSAGKAWGDKISEHDAPHTVDMRSSLGQDYWAMMELAGQYAYAGREWVANTVVGILGGKSVEVVHNHHNFAWREHHFGEDLIVVRKGATPAFPGQKGFVGGSMGDVSVILEGTNATHINDDRIVDIILTQTNALFSTVHGAGRVMSRTEAAGKRDRKTGALKLDKVTGLPLKPGRVTPDMMQEWITRENVVLRGGGLDESPHAYRRLPDVLKAQQETVTVLHTLQPLIVVMAGAHEFDPYKD